MEESPLWEISEKNSPEETDSAVEHSPDSRFHRVSLTQFSTILSHTPFKTVYPAFDDETGCEVAWHSLPLEPLSPDTLPKFYSDLQLFQSLSHPSLVNWISHWFDESSQTMVVVTERLPAGSLRDYIHKIKAPRLKVVKVWVRQLLEVFKYLHAVKPFPIIYGTLSLDNIYCMPSTGQIKLESLGKSIIFHDATSQICERQYEYIAPELFRDEVSRCMDIYSLGMCLLEICTQSVPYDECKTQVAKTRKIMSGHKPLALSRIQNEDLKEFVEMCLAPAEERMTAEQLLQQPFLSDFSDISCSKPIQLKSKHEGYLHSDPTTTIEVDMLIPPSCGKALRHIEFPFDLENDTPEGVAEEMVEELNLPQEFTPTLSRQISNFVWGKFHECPTLSSSHESLPETRWSEVEDENIYGDIQKQRLSLEDPPISFCLLKYGSENNPEAVKLLQSALICIYKTGGKADGVFGKKTESYVRRFQEDWKMEVTGIVDTELWWKVKEEWEKSEEEGLL